jgi:hypothetical protein
MQGKIRNEMAWKGMGWEGKAWHVKERHGNIGEGMT